MRFSTFFVWMKTKRFQTGIEFCRAARVAPEKPTSDGLPRDYSDATKDGGGMQEFASFRSAVEHCLGLEDENFTHAGTPPDLPEEYGVTQPDVQRLNQARAAVRSTAQSLRRNVQQSLKLDEEQLGEAIETINSVVSQVDAIAEFADNAMNELAQVMNLDSELRYEHFVSGRPMEADRSRQRGFRHSAQEIGDTLDRLELLLASSSVDEVTSSSLTDLELRCLIAVRGLKATSNDTRKTGGTIAQSVDSSYTRDNVKAQLAKLVKLKYLDSLANRASAGMPSGYFITEHGVNRLKTEGL